jgi:hypothetical protein
MSSIAGVKDIIWGRKLLIFLILISIVHIILFIYTDIFNNNQDSNKWEKGIDGLYFTTTTFSTVGYGDLSPSHWGAKLLVIFEQIMLIWLSFEEIGTYINKRVIL